MPPLIIRPDQYMHDPYRPVPRQLCLHDRGAPVGWVCTRDLHHDGPCAARPSFWNLREHLRTLRFRWEQRRHAPFTW